jgi:hypothetical protein
VIRGNIIGVDKTVSVPLPNGIGIAAGTGDQPIQIGGSAPGEGNIISGNGNMGVAVGTCPSLFANWIEQLKAEFVTAGCGPPGFYCPSSPNTRGQMATFLVKALGLP